MMHFLTAQARSVYLIIQLDNRIHLDNFRFDKAKCLRASSNITLFQPPHCLHLNSVAPIVESTAGSNDPTGDFSSWSDIVVEMEEVVRVVLCFDRSESCVVLGT